MGGTYTVQPNDSMGGRRVKVRSSIFGGGVEFRVVASLIKGGRKKEEEGSRRRKRRTHGRFFTHGIIKKKLGRQRETEGGGGLYWRLRKGGRFVKG